MADNDTSFHEGTPSPLDVDGTVSSFGWSKTGGEVLSGKNSYAHPDTPFPPANPVAFQDNKQ